MDPPACVQNAMMTKDKKPFTYTPGGIDLSEVRSPRMQRRIERNANLGGVGDVPKLPQQAQNIGPLPPSALAAMRPQTQVQVFPQPPPPPPMQKSMPPPPPPPMGPLPTQKVTMTDNQVVERPDMTKIIPENPMTLLRKTGGPAPRKTFVDEMYSQQSKAPPSPPQRQYEPLQSGQPPIIERSPPVQQQQPNYQIPPVRQYEPEPQRYQPPVIERSPPVQPQQQPSFPAQPQRYQPSVIERPAPVSPPTQQSQRPQQYQPQPQTFQPPVIERQPPAPRQPERAINSNVGSLYIPPINQQAQQNQQKRVVSPPSPPERQEQSPGTPTLKEAPKPWQAKPVQSQQELPPWARREEESINQGPQPSPANNAQQRWQQPPQQPARPPQQQYSPKSPSTQDQHPSNEPDEKKPNAVYVTQPVILQHPGPRINAQQQRPQAPPQTQPKQQTQPKVDSQGARIIPIHVEGRTPPSTPGAERNLSRQLSWGTQPPQSNSFKVIQKITRTDDDEDEDTPVTHHSPRYTQQMPEQVRKMKINDNDRFKQVSQSPGGRVDPRITVPAEADTQQQRYVHPSEQVVPEPKKYMGSNIPSRSFKILQAMTAPDSCANANYDEEIPYNPTFNPYNYPYYPPPPYWHAFYQDQRSESCKTDEASVKSGRSTPSHASYANGRTTPLPKGRNTPLPPPPMYGPPFWGYLPAYYPSKPHEQIDSEGETKDSSRTSAHFHPMYPPYFDPYYYGYYYGYPPFMPAYPFYSDGEEMSGYSSADEMASYNRRPSLKRRNSLENSVQALRQHFEVRSKSATPRVVVTPSSSQEKVPKQATNRDTREEDEHYQPSDAKPNEICRLKSIKSVPNINVYDDEDLTDTETSGSDESTEDEDEEIQIVEGEEETIPHQLSIIFEESERTESRSLRPSSVISETTTIADKSDEDDYLDDGMVSKVFGIHVTEGKREELDVAMDAFEEETQVLFTFISPNLTPRNASPVSLQNEEDQVPLEQPVVLRRKKEARAGQFWGEKDEVSKSTKCVYDKLKESDLLELTNDSGKLMEMESFVEKLEQIKRNSGLWSYEETDLIADEKSPDVEEAKESGDSEESEIDFWSQIKNDDDDFLPRRRSYATNYGYDEESIGDQPAGNEQDLTVTGSAGSLTSSPVESVVRESDVENATQIAESNPHDVDEDTSDSESSSSSSYEEQKSEEIKPDTAEPQTIKERIEALRNSIAQKQNKIKEKDEVMVCVKSKISAIEVTGEARSKTASTKSSIKSFEEYSEEEEGDSGVISDISRHISDSEEFPELRKMTRYERAATHSRLFKLLQEECDSDEEEEDERNRSQDGRSRLSLPLHKCEAGAVNEKLVDELVQSILLRRKGQAFKNMPKEKLYAAAVKILQEDFDNTETPSEEFSSLLSPLRSGTENSTPAQTPQEFYSNCNEYKQYYESWNEAGKEYDETNEIVPSKAFKLLQERISSSKLGVIEGFLAKCPRIMSAKVLDGSDRIPSPPTQNSNEVTNTS
ncbi:uncharacterized protein LOC132700207 isoform X2 [Cylas formicarius]|uniref:uncharacterized protein LOC132700207 isoform X2 n=1 Tax=Cylas formicarius TaxID=197179 RepID=UPI002958AE04|nr:uncharacterized protein LOC132700207 isoform X2 [Cylas formicarius]